MKASTDAIASFHEDVAGWLCTRSINVAGWPGDSGENNDHRLPDLVKGGLR
jgi:hypothetical protein